MQSLKSSVLVVGHPTPQQISFGADFAADLAEAQKFLEANAYSVVAFPAKLLTPATFKAVSDSFNSHNPSPQKVLIAEGANADQLRRAINLGHVFKVIQEFGDQQFEHAVEEALSEHLLARQNSQLLDLVNQQNDSLKRLSLDLEDRVEKRQKFLEDTRAKLLQTNHRVEGLHRAFVAVHRATNVAEMERLVNEALNSALGLAWTRIVFRSQQTSLGPAQLAERQGLVVFDSPLTRGGEQIGKIYFAREQDRPFTKDEGAFLSQVTDAVALAMDRLLKLEQSETLKAQWDATFDAILEPVSLMDKDYTLLRTNKAYVKHTGLSFDKVIGKKCYAVLFGRKVPCETCKLGQSFRLPPKKTPGDQNVIFDVHSQSLQFKPEGKTVYVNMYRDISMQQKLERQILESAKMAELGTIGSSIAHELNNPLGGMLSFLQLIQMDLNGNEPYFSDINDMEKGARRCREIVQNLLGFTRKSTTDEVREVDLREVINQALKITELQTRATGIEVKVSVPDTPIMVSGQFNYLAQAVRSFLQKSQEAISERKRREQKHSGQITIVLTESANVYSLVIDDNGVGFDSEKPIPDSTGFPHRNAQLSGSLGFTVALQIINDHGGRLDISSSPAGGTQAKISFPISSQQD